MSLLEARSLHIIYRGNVKKFGNEQSSFFSVFTEFP